MTAETTEETGLLPADWLTEGVQEASCQTVGDRHRLSLEAMPGMRYFGVRLAGTCVAGAFSTGRIALSYRVISHQDVAGLYLVMREWRQAGQFNFQTQKSLPLTPDISAAELCLSLREDGMVLEPVLLFEADEVGLSPDVTVFIEDLSFDIS